jgi:hypothetical protein
MRTGRARAGRFDPGDVWFSARVLVCSRTVDARSWDCGVRQTASLRFRCRAARQKRGGGLIRCVPTGVRRSVISLKPVVFCFSGNGKPSAASPHRAGGLPIIGTSCTQIKVDCAVDYVMEVVLSLVLTARQQTTNHLREDEVFHNGRRRKLGVEEDAAGSRHDMLVQSIW